MRFSFILAAALVSMFGFSSLATFQSNQKLNPTESRIKIDNNSLYVRVIGKGQPVIVLHGGPDFDHSYFLPDLDRLKDTFRLIYYDQRGRGKSADNVRPEDVTLISDLNDIDGVRQHFRLNSVVLLGHSWGTVLALEYAL
jgi:proline iminopeptidase